ncbi:MAG: lipid-A-disaccharide synthase [Alphaproteobacteria bacterium]|nr:lipid-A-disaccharide synthase [Alphaproteobacteria bacterium]
MQNKKLKIFIIAGEVSGDCLGARIMSAIPNADFVGIGGENMIACGLSTLFPMSDLSVMGVIEVVAHAQTLTKRIKETVAAIINEKPDVVLTIDSPGFARSVVNGVRESALGQRLIRNGLKFHHVVAPQVWAWRPGRAKKYARTFDKLYAFFDFEIPYFTKYGLETIAIGHPIADGIIGKYENNSTNDKIITLIPGSRMTEVKKLLPLFKQTIDMMTRCGYTDYKFIIPTVETTDKYIRAQVKHWQTKPTLVSSTERFDWYSKTYIAIAASGTVTAELAMMHIPTIVVYKMNRITTLIGHLLIHVKWVSLVNILLNRTVYPELLGGDANVENIMNSFCELIIPSVHEKMVTELKQADTLWRKKNTDSCKLIAKSLIN